MTLISTVTTVTVPDTIQLGRILTILGKLEASEPLVGKTLEYWITKGSDPAVHYADRLTDSSGVATFNININESNFFGTAPLTDITVDVIFQGDTFYATSHQSHDIAVINAPTAGKTEIQKVIDYLSVINPTMTVVQFGTPDEISARTKVVSVQEVTKQPTPLAWGNLIDVQDGTMTVGYAYAVSFKIHCISYLSFDEADRLAQAVEHSFKWRGMNFNQDIPVTLLAYDIISVVDLYRRPALPVLEPEVWRVIVDIDLRMMHTQDVSVDMIDTINIKGEESD